MQINSGVVCHWVLRSPAELFPASSISCLTTSGCRVAHGVNMFLVHLCADIDAAARLHLSLYIAHFTCVHVVITFYFVTFQRVVRRCKLPASVAYDCRNVATNKSLFNTVTYWNVISARWLVFDRLLTTARCRIVFRGFDSFSRLYLPVINVNY